MLLVQNLMIYTRLRDKFYDLTVNTEPVWIRELRYAEEHTTSFTTDGR